MMDDPQLQEAAERNTLLTRAREFERLLELPGWKEIYALHLAWTDKAMDALRTVNTNDEAVALDTLRRWQLAEDLLRLEAKYINDTLEKAMELQGRMTLEEALLMEQVKKHEQSQPTTGTGTDSTGY